MMMVLSDFPAQGEFCSQLTTARRSDPRVPSNQIREVVVSVRFQVEEPTQLQGRRGSAQVHLQPGHVLHAKVPGEAPKGCVAINMSALAGVEAVLDFVRDLPQRVEVKKLEVIDDVSVSATRVMEDGLTLNPLLSRSQLQLKTQGLLGFKQEGALEWENSSGSRLVVCNWRARLRKLQFARIQPVKSKRAAVTLHLASARTCSPLIADPRLPIVTSLVLFSFPSRPSFFLS